MMNISSTIKLSTEIFMNWKRAKQNHDRFPADKTPNVKKKLIAFAKLATDPSYTRLK